MAKVKMTEKDPKLVEILEQSFGQKRDGNQCMICGSEKVDSGDFDDPLSVREFSISGMCQKCQNKFFGG